MTEEFDFDETINDEWIKLLDYVKENFSDDYDAIEDMRAKHGKLLKQLFEQGYRSGWNDATNVITESLTDRTEFTRPN